MPTTERYARALVAQKAMELREAVNAVMAHETDDIIHHRLAEVATECKWVAKNYGG